VRAHRIRTKCALTLVLILTPLQKIILEIMLCETDNKSLLVEDHPPNSIENQGETVPASRRTGLKFNRKSSPFGGPI
jgi:hypothetical protein